MSAKTHKTSRKWKETRFRYLAGVCKGFLPPSEISADSNAERIPYLTMEYLRGEVDEPTLVPNAPDLLLASDDDFLLLWDGSNAGEFVRAKRGAVSSTTALVVTKSADPEFFYWACKEQEELLRAETTGMGIPHVNGEFLSNLRIRLPNANHQRSIADYLDRETARLDELLVEKERLLGLLTEKRVAVINRAITLGLDLDVPFQESGISGPGKTPAHWTRSHLKRLVESMDYGISVPVETSGEIAVLRMGDIQDGEIDYSKIGFVSEVDQRLLLQPGDLVFNRTNSLDQIGKVALFRGYPDFPVSFASYLVRLRCSRRVVPEFMNLLLNSVYPLAWGRAHALPAIGQVNLNPNRYGYLPVSLPPIEEQNEIIRFILNWTDRIDAIRTETIRTIDLIGQRRAALISAAVTGKLEIT